MVLLLVFLVLRYSVDGVAAALGCLLLYYHTCMLLLMLIIILVKFTFIYTITPAAADADHHPGEVALI